MTFEEMERTMEFILNQQAKFSVDIELLKESIVEMKTQADLDRAIIKDAIAEMRDGMTTMLGIAERMEKTTSNLVLAQTGLSQRVTRLEDRVDHLEES